MNNLWYCYPVICFSKCTTCPQAVENLQISLFLLLSDAEFLVDMPTMLFAYFCLLCHIFGLQKCYGQNELVVHVFDDVCLYVDLFPKAINFLLHYKLTLYNLILQVLHLFCLLKPLYSYCFFRLYTNNLLKFLLLRLFCHQLPLDIFFECLFSHLLTKPWGRFWRFCKYHHSANRPI